MSCLNDRFLLNLIADNLGFTALIKFQQGKKWPKYRILKEALIPISMENWKKIMPAFLSNENELILIIHEISN